MQFLEEVEILEGLKLLQKLNLSGSYKQGCNMSEVKISLWLLSSQLEISDMLKVSVFTSKILAKGRSAGGWCSLLMAENSGVWHGLKPFVTMVVIQVVYTAMNVLYKLAENDGMNLRILIAYRLIFATVFTAPLAVFLERRKWPKFTWVLIFEAFFSGLFGASLGQTLYAESLALTSATFATAITNLVPAFTLVLAVSLRFESLGLNTRIGKAKAVGTLIGVIGAMVLTFFKGVGFKNLSLHVQILKPKETHNHHQTGNQILGLLMALGSCVSFAVWLIMQAKMGERYSCHYSSTALMSMMASIQSVVFCLLVERDWSQWKLGWNIRLLAAAFAGIVSSGLAMISIAWIVEIRGPVFASAFNPLSLVFVAIISSLLLGEELHLGSIIGGILIVCGLYLVLWGKIKEFKQKAEELAETSGTHLPSQLDEGITVGRKPTSSHGVVAISDGDSQCQTRNHLEIEN